MNSTNSTYFDELEVKLEECVESCANFISNYQKIRHWDIYGGCSQSAGIEIEKGFIKNSRVTQSSIITIRVFGKDGNIGSSSTNRLGKSHLKEIIKDAVNLMVVSLPNPEFAGLVIPPKNYPKVKTPWDSSISTLNVEETANIADSFIEQKKRDQRIKSVSGGVNYGDYRVRILNSNGIDIKEKSSSASINAEFTLEDIKKGNKINSNGYDGQSYNYFNAIETEKILDNAYNLALKGLDKINIETGTYPVILSPLGTHHMINSTISSAINGEMAYRKRSFLHDKLGKKIASDILDIIDDPWKQGGLYTGPFDPEGTPTQPLNIVKNGVLCSFLHNFYSANLFKTQSTGHAYRGYGSANLGIAPSNLVMKTGDISYSDLISDVKKGIYLNSTSDEPNLITGEFSGKIMSGFIIENGEIGAAIRECMFGPQLLDMYDKIEAISKEKIRKYSNYMPFTSISELKISGSKN